MAIKANTYLTFDSKGNREELSDIIYSITPEDTPFMSMASKEKFSATNPEWQTDSLAAVDTTNAQLEGDDISTFTAITPTVRVGTYTQISYKTLIASGTQEAINKAGRKSDLARETAKRGKELKRDMEAICLTAQAGVAGNSTTARKTAGLNAWIKTNTDFGAGGVDPTYTSGVPNAARTDGTLRAFTETILKTVLQEGWTSGASFDTLMVGPVNKGKASAFTGIATKNYDLSGTPKKSAIIASADVYVGEFDRITIMPNRYQREADGWLLDSEYLAIGHLRPFFRKDLAATGDAEKRMLVVEWGLKVKQEAALGICADLTTT